MNHEILRGRVEEACNKIADNGIEGVDDKEVTLACFGMLMFNGFESIQKTMNRATFTFVGTTISTLIAIILVLVFIV